jgi:LPS-assembly protein
MIEHNPIIRRQILNDKTYNERKFRFYPELYTEWSWPFIKFMQNHPIIIEPVVGLAIAPSIKKLRNVNSDSQAPEISAVNVFTSNRFTGYDKIEDGNRMNYGFKSNIRSPYFKNLNILVGQVLRQRSDQEFDSRGGLAGNRSDYVTKTVLQLNGNVSISHRARYDRKHFTPMRNELNLSFSDTTYFISAIYAGADRKVLDYYNNQKYRQELLAQAGYNIYDAFWLKGHVYMGLRKKIKLDRKSMIEDGLGLEYRGDCLNFEIGLKRNTINFDTNAKPVTTKYFRFTIPTF